MGINRLLIDCQIRTKTGWDREEGRRTRCRAMDDSLQQQRVQWLNDCCGSQARWLSTFGGHSNDSMSGPGPSTPLMYIACCQLPASTYPTCPATHVVTRK